MDFGVVRMREGVVIPVDDCADAHLWVGSVKKER
jgi:hypothetical protein